MYLISFYVPRDHAQSVKSSMFRAGAGKMGNYDCCSFETLGDGQFRPLENANPFLGKIGEVEQVPELKVEMICNKSAIAEVILALKKNHPYETPAYHVISILDY
jgi:hypothetical protein